MTKIVPVVLCGGSGTRLWPRSRASKPKPFLPLVGGDSLFRETIGRCADPAAFLPPIIVTGMAHLEHVEAQLDRDSGATIIIEPCARNTAAAIALAAHRVGRDAIMLVCPSDHHIGNSGAFRAAVQKAADLAAQDWLVALGIAPTAPETGYGYLRRGEPIGDDGFRVAQFVEKPDRARAEAFCADDAYAWNGGIFAFRAGMFLDELARYRPAIAMAAANAIGAGTEEGARFYPDPESFAEIESESVDYAVMENTDRAAMVPAAMDWSDIGNWQALFEARDRDDNGNCVRGRAELVDCTNVMIDSDGPRVSAIGLRNIVIVVDGDEILVTSADGVQKVGKLEGAAKQ